MTPNEAAKRLGCTENHIRTLIGDRDIPYFRFGNHVRFEKREVEAYAEVSVSTELDGLARVKRARKRRMLMIERRLPFRVAGAIQNKYIHPPASGFQTSELPEKQGRPRLRPNDVANPLRVTERDILHDAFGGELHYQSEKGRVWLEPSEINAYLPRARYEVGVF